jgi:ketosteroid isomerase-like protein
VERSEEIRRVIDRYTRAIADADAESALGRLSEHPGTLIVGTDPGEWWRGSEIRAIWGRQIEELRGVFFVRADEIEAWEHGNVGWAAVRETISVEGRMLEARATYVLRLERGEWKVVQTHWSIPRANVEAFGRGLTVTIDELEEIVRSSRPDLSEALASDGTVTIVFTDIVDSTVVLGRVGDRAWLELLRRHDALIARATSAHGGTLVETQGDGSMLAFPSARRALRVPRRYSRKLAVHSASTHRSVSGSASTQATRFTRATASSARPFTTRRGWPPKLSAEKS